MIECHRQNISLGVRDARWAVLNTGHALRGLPATSGRNYGPFRAR